MPVLGKPNSLIIQCGSLIEGRAAAARLKRARHGAIGLFQAWDGSIAGLPALVVVSGVGPSESGIAAAEAIRMFQPCGLIDFGAATALNKSWAIGQCGLVETATAYRPPALIPPPGEDAPRGRTASARGNPEWIKAAEEALKLKRVKVGSADKPVINVHMAHYLSTAHGFDWISGESYSVLNAGERLGVPALALRTVSGYCGPEAAELFERNLRRALRGAAALLEPCIEALRKAELLRDRP